MKIFPASLYEHPKTLIPGLTWYCESNPHVNSLITGISQQMKPMNMDTYWHGNTYMYTCLNMNTQHDVVLTSSACSNPFLCHSIFDKNNLNSNCKTYQIVDKYWCMHLYIQILDLMPSYSQRNMYAIHIFSTHNTCILQISDMHLHLLVNG